MKTYFRYGVVILSETVFISAMGEISIKSAFKCSKSDSWYKALISELKTISKNDTFEEVSRPPSQICVGSRFSLTKKYGPYGSLLNFKARLAAKGFDQKPGIDFRETF